MNGIPQAQAGPVFDPSQYPRTYSASGWWLAAMMALGAVAGIGGLAGIWYFGTGHETNSIGERIGLTTLCLGFALLGAYLILGTIRSKVVLLPDAVVSQGLFLTRTLQRSEIKGYRTRTANGVTALEVHPKSAGQRKMSITMLFTGDRAFTAWFLELPNLDQEEFLQSAKEIEGNREIGHSPAERIEKAERARKTSRMLNIAAGGLGAWVLFYPRPYVPLMTLLMLVPWIGIAIAKGSNGLFTIEDPGKNTAKADLTLLLIMPGFALALRDLFDIQLLDWTAVVLPAAVGGAMITAMLLGMFPAMRKRKFNIMLVPVFLAVYAGSSLVMTNALLDQSRPESYPVKIVKKHYTSGRSTTYYFTVPAWGPRPAPDDVTVSPSHYHAKQVGDDVCIFLFPGRLGFPWFVVEDCRT